MTFHGLASPNELKTTWFNMTEGQDLPDLNVIWEFDESALNNILESSYDCSLPSSTSLFVVNCLYKVNPNMIGHYVALYKNQNELIYFDPLATFPQKWVIDCCFKFDIKIIVDLEGAQAINGNSCGFRCLFKLLKYCLGYMPENYAELFGNRIDWFISRPDKKNFINTTIKKTKREIETIKTTSSRNAMHSVSSNQSN